MSKHPNTFRSIVHGSLQQQHTAGLTQGAYAMCEVILDKAADETKAAEQKLEDIVGFCKVCTQNKSCD